MMLTSAQPAYAKLGVYGAIGLVLGWLAPTVLWAQPLPLSVGSTPLRPGTFELALEGERLSLRAREAPLKAIVKAIGQRLRIDVVTKIPETETVTLAFEGLELIEALKRLDANAIYFTTEREGKRQVTKIILLAKGKRAADSAPFKFQFDPLKARRPPARSNLPPAITPATKPAITKGKD